MSEPSRATGKGRMPQNGQFSDTSMPTRPRVPTGSGGDFISVGVGTVSACALEWGWRTPISRTEPSLI